MMALDIAGVRKSYGSVPVLHDVDLRVAAGTVTAILGASGAGKTTLLRVIAGFEAADAGVVTLDGAVVDDGRRRTPPERRRIGYVPQDGALFPHLTVRANAAFALPRRLRRDGEVDDVLRMLGLEDLAQRHPGELSGGQQQRVAIARALVSKPKLVLLDEPFASLDASLRALVRAEVLGVLRAKGTTVVLVTHDQDEALSVADYVAVLRDGVITQSGPPKEVYQRPADPWTASFLGTANLLRGELTPAGTDTDAASDAGSGAGEHHAAHAGARVRTTLGWHELHPDARSCSGDVTVLVRPEQIQLTPAVNGAADGEVRLTRYHGHDALVEVDTGDAGVLRVRTIGADPPEPGSRVILRVDGPVMAWPCTTS